MVDARRRQRLGFVRTIRRHRRFTHRRPARGDLIQPFAYPLTQRRGSQRDRFQTADALRKYGDTFSLLIERTLGSQARAGHVSRAVDLRLLQSFAYPLAQRRGSQRDRLQTTDALRKHGDPLGLLIERTLGPKRAFGSHARTRRVSGAVDLRQHLHRARAVQTKARDHHQRGLLRGGKPFLAQVHTRLCQHPIGTPHAHREPHDQRRKQPRDHHPTDGDSVTIEFHLHRTTTTFTQPTCYGYHPPIPTWLRHVHILLTR